MISDAVGPTLEFNALAYDNPRLGRFHTGDQSSSAALDQKHDFHGEITWLSDLGTGYEETTWLPMRSPPAGTKNVGSKRPHKMKGGCF